MAVTYMARSSTHRPVQILLFLGLALLGLLHSPLVAQNRDRGPLILELPASTRALGMANSYALGAPDSDLVFYHPGLLSRAQGLSGSVQRYSSHSTLAAVSAGRSWLSGGVAIGIQVLTYGAAGSEPTEGKDLMALPSDVGSLRENGEKGVSEFVASAGYGQTVKGVRMGLVGKLVQQRFGSIQGSTGALDMGIMASPGPVTLGLSAQNIGSGLTMGEEHISLPTRFTLGASTDRTAVGPLDLSASSAVSYRLDGHVVPSAGVEVAYWPVTGRTFVGRFGYRYLPDEQSGWPLTFGGGFYGDAIVLEYAYEGFDSGQGAHRVSLGWR
jgi:hypothetical protein